MKYLKISLALAGTLVLGSCHNAKLDDLKDQAFITQTETQASKLSTLQVSSTETTASVTVRLSDPQTEDKTFKLRVSDEALQSYNRANGTNYVLLPSDYYTLSSEEVVVKAGGVYSNQLNCVIKPISQDMLDSGNKYAVAFKLEGNNGMGIVQGGDVFIYAIQPVIETAVPVLGTFGGSYKKAVATTTPVDLASWTIEMRVNMTGFDRNNQALLGIWGTNGSEIYMRFGDAPTPFNTLNIKFGGPQIDESNTKFEANKWYHIALVYDGAKATLYVNGQKDTETDKPAGRPFNISTGISVAGSGAQWFPNAVMMSEVRVWNTARSEKQINENQYSVSPKTPGLIHYWKMNEGEGSELKNSVSGGPSLMVMTGDDKSITPTWLTGVRSDGTGRTSVNN